MTRITNHRRRGNALIEFTLVGIPMIFVLISIFEMSRGMWIYHTLAHALKEGTRYASVHGQSCYNGTAPCPITIADVANRVKDSGVGLIPDELNITISSMACTGCTAVQSVACNPLSSCFLNTTQFPSDKAGNEPGLSEVAITGTYPFRSAIAMFWPGAHGGIQFPAFNLPASARERVHF
jgi:hypothetical protein